MAFPILGANTATGAYDIENSLRLDSGSSAYLYRDQVDPTSEGQIYTISVWNKICFTDGQNATLLMGGDADGSGATVDETWFMHNVAGTIFFQDALNDSTVLGKQTASLQRDPAAWYHFMLSVDTTQGTDTNRLKVYINGSDVSADMTGGWPVQNVVHQLNKETSGANQLAHFIGRQMRGSNYSDMYVANFAFVDGTQLTPSSFGETDEDSGIWKPKSASVTWGDNGFFLEFKNSAVGTGAADTIGADTSGNNNHFTSSGVAVTDQTTDTPTNNFCTLNPLVPRHSNFTFNEGNCGVLVGHDNNFVWGTMAGKMNSSSVGWYYELRLGAAPVGGSGYGLGVGVGDFDYAVGVEGIGADGGWSMSGDTAKLIGTNFAYSANYTLQDNGGGNKIDLGVDTNLGEIIQVAWKNSKVFLGVNNTYYATDTGTDGDPANGTNPSHTITSTYEGENWMPILNSSLAGATLSKFNFGNPPFSISSGNADANGYGNFEFAPPSGYYALCTKNLAEFGG